MVEYFFMGLALLLAVVILVAAGWLRDQRRTGRKGRIGRRILASGCVFVFGAACLAVGLLLFVSWWHRGEETEDTVGGVLLATAVGAALCGTGIRFWFRLWPGTRKGRERELAREWAVVETRLGRPIPKALKGLLTDCEAESVRYDERTGDLRLHRLNTDAPLPLSHEGVDSGVLVYPFATGTFPFVVSLEWIVVFLAPDGPDVGEAIFAASPTEEHTIRREDIFVLASDAGNSPLASGNFWPPRPPARGIYR